MTLLEALILGIVQGVFMFMPVSSTSHLALLQQYLINTGSDMPSPASSELILFDLVVHVGTVVSIGIIFRRSLKRVIAGVASDARHTLQKSVTGSTTYLRLAGLCMVSLFATGVIGLVVLKVGTEVFETPTIIAFNLIVTGVLLWWTDKVSKNSKGPAELTVKIAIIIGIAQGFALLPGLSRSGLTIAIALFLGLRRQWAAMYSFFLAIPTILAASAVQLALVLAEGEPLLIEPMAFLVGFTAAAIVGTAALAAVLWLLYKAQFRVFSYYVWILAALVLSGVIL